MMLDLQNFAVALATWMASQASVQFASTPRQLWLHHATGPDSQRTDPYAVLRIYDGAVPWVPVAEVRAQIWVTGSNDTAAMQFAQKLQGAFLDAQGRPVRMVTIAAPGARTVGWRLNGADARLPGLIGRDEAKQWGEVVFNVEMKVVCLPATA